MNRKKQKITKYNHKPRIISERALPKKSIKSHYMVKFQYNSKNKYDNNPFVYVLPPRNEDRKFSQRSKTHIYGINLNYLTKQEVNYLLNETGVIKKSPNWVVFKRYDEYKDAFRTYLVDDMSNVKIIKYKTDKMIQQEKRMLKLKEKKWKEDEIKKLKNKKD